MTMMTIIPNVCPMKSAIAIGIPQKAVEIMATFYAHLSAVGAGLPRQRTVPWPSDPMRASTVNICAHLETYGLELIK